MRTIIWFFITCIIATIGFFAALTMRTPWIGFAVAFSCWGAFLLGITKPKRH